MTVLQITLTDDESGDTLTLLLTKEGDMYKLSADYNGQTETVSRFGKCDIQIDDEVKRPVITRKAFLAAVGYQPEQDDLDRVNCPNSGKVGHWLCGWCHDHNKPRFICMCDARDK